MMTQETFRWVFERGFEYAKAAHTREPGGLITPGKCIWEVEPTQDVITTKYEQFLSDNTFNDRPQETRVYAYRTVAGHTPAIRAFTSYQIGTDEMAREIAPAGVQVESLGTLHDVLVAPDKRLPPTWIENVTNDRRGQYTEVGMTPIYDRLEPADEVTAEIPRDATLTVGNNEYDITNFEYDLSRSGDDIVLTPELIEAKRDERITIEF